MTPEITATTNSETILGSFGSWKGKQVFVSEWVYLSSPHEHILAVVHHTDEAGRHFCPTMFLMCALCGGIADEPEPYECDK